MTDTDQPAPLSADELAWIRKSLECPERHVCANHPIHAQAKIAMLRMHIERLLPMAESATALRAAIFEDHTDDHLYLGGYRCRLCDYDIAPDIPESHDPQCALYVESAP